MSFFRIKYCKFFRKILRNCIYLKYRIKTGKFFIVKKSGTFAKKDRKLFSKKNSGISFIWNQKILKNGYGLQTNYKKMDMVYNWFFFIGLVWFSYKMDLVIKIGFGLDSILVMVNQIFCTPSRVPALLLLLSLPTLPPHVPKQNSHTNNAWYRYTTHTNTQKHLKNNNSMINVNLIYKRSFHYAHSHLICHWPTNKTFLYATTCQSHHVYTQTRRRNCDNNNV